MRGALGITRGGAGGRVAAWLELDRSRTTAVRKKTSLRADDSSAQGALRCAAAAAASRPALPSLRGGSADGAWRPPGPRRPHGTSRPPAPPDGRRASAAQVVLVYTERFWSKLVVPGGQLLRAGPARGEWSHFLDVSDLAARPALVAVIAGRWSASIPPPSRPTVNPAWGGGCGPASAVAAIRVVASVQVHSRRKVKRGGSGSAVAGCRIVRARPGVPSRTVRARACALSGGWPDPGGARRAAEAMEARPDAEVVAAAAAALKRLVAPAEPPGPPVEHHVTRWGADRWARGACAAVPPGGSRRDIQELARPLESGRLLFAGEAASPLYHATVRAREGQGRGGR